VNGVNAAPAVLLPAFAFPGKQRHRGAARRASATGGALN